MLTNPPPGRHRPQRRAPRASPWLVATAAGWVALLGCSHDWDAYLPPDGAGGGSSSSGGGGSSSSTASSGTAGAGGSPGACPPAADGTAPLVLLATPDGGAECIDATEVTRGQYESWLNAPGTPPALPAACLFNTSYEPAASWPPAGVGLNKPVAHINWCDAYTYCKSNGKRLCRRIGGGPLPTSAFTDPSQSEWFNACTSRGTRPFPYGDSYQGSTCNGSDLGLGSTTDVGAQSGCVDATGQVFDLSGNVWEWEDSCAAQTGETDQCRIRGGGFNNGETNMACAADAPTQRSATAVNVGFRCCADPL